MVSDTHEKVTYAGLSGEQVEQRKRDGKTNVEVGRLSKPVRTILRENICTIFNLVNICLACAILSVGAYKNVLFMTIVLSNLVIGVVQELRAKKTLDKLQLMNESLVTVRRDGELRQIPSSEVVQDDLLRFVAGERICADCMVLSGSCTADESFLTGESEPCVRDADDELLAGSYLVTGAVWAKAVRVGHDSRMAQITADAKRQHRAYSEIMSSLTKLVQIMAALIVPVGAVLFYRQLQLPGVTFSDCVVSSSAALVSMIPEGLMLLTSSVLAVGVIRLSKRQVLVQELTAIESLARVDVLCLDKTGTLTSGRMVPGGVTPLSQDVTEAQCREMLARLCYAVEDENPTMTALRGSFSRPSGAPPLRVVPFSSAYKWSGAAFADQTLVLGAPEWVGKLEDAQLETLHELENEGRVLMLSRSSAPFPGEDGELPDGLAPVCLVCLHDELRPTAKKTLAYFHSQDVDIRVISGDSVRTVSGVARRCGIEDWDKAVDASKLSDEELVQAAPDTRVFGRVTPMQKKLLIQTLQKAGHTVAMTGDGVNDVPALKAADCGVAMASGASAARSTAKLVLLDSDFDSLPAVVGEGRRSINNLQRSASLFLVKTIYSTIFAVAFAFLPWQYPFVPIQISLISGLTIGTPSFILALEPNKDRIRGSFFANVLEQALPGAAAVLTCVFLHCLWGNHNGVPQQEISTLCLLTTGFTGLMIVLRACLPFTPIRAALFACMSIGFVGAVTILGGFFEVYPLSSPSWIVLCIALVITLVLFWGGTFLCRRIFQRKK